MVTVVIEVKRMVVGQVVEVTAGGAAFYVELGEETEEGFRAEDGVGVVASVGALDLEGVRDTIGAVAGMLTQVWDEVKPAEATVEFSLKVVGKSGKLTGLLVECGGEAALKVSLKWEPEQVGDVDGAPGD